MARSIAVLRGSVELAVDRGRLALDRVLGQVQSLADLQEREMGGEIGKQPQLCRRQAHHRGAGRAGGRRHAFAQLPYLLGEGATCGRCSSTCSVSVKTVRAAAASPSARWARVSSRPTWMLSQGGRGRAGAAGGGRATMPRGHRPAVLREGRRVPPPHARWRSCIVAETGFLDASLGLACVPCGLAPGTLPRGEERELCLGRKGVLIGAHVDGRGQVGPRQVGGAEQRMSDTRMSNALGRQGLAGANCSTARCASASARSTPSIIMNARRIATQGAIVALPSESGSPRWRPRRGKPPLGLCRAPGPRANPGAVEGERGTAPARRGRTSQATPPRSPCARRNTTARPAGRPGRPGWRSRRRHGVTDRLLGQIVGHAPGHRAAVELRDCFGVATLELVSQ